mmetsp:Transcript_77492/g.224877  ORF Transcript_77492/g.224877 Transcript_77492/m.224877 type:complete len:206 (-) Transcript_77492:32-649(-)
MGFPSNLVSLAAIGVDLERSRAIRDARSRPLQLQKNLRTLGIHHRRNIADLNRFGELVQGLLQVAILKRFGSGLLELALLIHLFIGQLRLAAWALLRIWLRVLLQALGILLLGFFWLLRLLLRLLLHLFLLGRVYPLWPRSPGRLIFAGRRLRWHLRAPTQDELLEKRQLGRVNECRIVLELCNEGLNGLQLCRGCHCHARSLHR